MAQFVNSLVLDNGLNYIKTNCDKVVVVSAFTVGDTYETVVANTLASAQTTPSDFTLASSGNDRTITFAAGIKDSSANASGTSDHIAYLDTVGAQVLWATEETSKQPVTLGNTVTFPALVYTATQPILPK